MSRRFSPAHLASALSFAALLGGFSGACSHSKSASAPPSVICPQPSGCSQPGPGTSELGSPTISFQQDVIPLFQTSCATSQTCHQGIDGSTVPAMSLLYLGDGADASPPTDPNSVYGGLLTPSHELTTMNYVTAGDPTHSFLMHKMDGDICQFLDECSVIPASPIPCGAVMPEPCALDDGPRDVVRRWIAQGAGYN